MLKAESRNMATHYSHKFVWQAMTDYKTYVQVGIYIGCVPYNPYRLEHC